jgi:DNA-directed RNA polymerase specialized sigma subunit
MNEKMKKIVWDYFVDDKSYREIGNHLGISKQAVHAFIRRHNKDYQQATIQLYPLLQKDTTPLYQRLRMKRKMLGLSQIDIAEKLGTTKQYVCRLEKGDIKTGSHVKFLSEWLAVE